MENFTLMTRNNHTIEHGKGYQDGYEQGLVDGRTKQVKVLKEEIRELQDVIGTLSCAGHLHSLQDHLSISP